MKLLAVFLTMVACLLAVSWEVYSAEDAGSSWGMFDPSCHEGEDAHANASVACHGARILWKAVGNWLDSAETLRLSDGVQIVKVHDDVTSSSRNLVDGGGDDSIMGRASRFANSHELRVRLSDVLPSVEEMLGTSKTGDSGQGTGRGKNKGGGLAMVAAMGMMMKGVLGAIGLGGAALLAMKALMVSLMALMLSAIVGVKKLASGHEDHGTHHVQVVPVHHSGGEHGHYRKRRSDPYRAYRHLAN